MALVKFGGGVSEISGSIGGTTFARNRAGAYARQWTKPINPGTVRQSAVRTAFGAIATAWGSLTTAEREAWNSVANTVSRLNGIGEEYTPKGRQYFMETATNLQIVGQTLLTTPGVTSQAPSYDSGGDITATAAGGELDELEMAALTMTIPSGAEGAVVIFASPIHSTRKTNVNNQMRLIFAGQLGTPPEDLLASYTAVFGAAAQPLQAIDFSIHVVDLGTGLASPKKLQTVIIP